MKIYLVGGAVRDKLLNIEVYENDWVVVGASENELASKGYKKIGKDFPVFLHPETKEEYALARNDYWDRLSINGWTHRTQGEGSPGYNYILRAEELDTLKANYESKLVPLPDASDQFIMPEQHFIDVKLTKL